MRRYLWCISRYKVHKINSIGWKECCREAFKEVRGMDEGGMNDGKGEIIYDISFGEKKWKKRKNVCHCNPSWSKYYIFSFKFYPHFTIGEIRVKIKKKKKDKHTWGEIFMQLLRAYSFQDKFWRTRMDVKSKIEWWKKKKKNLQIFE